MYGIEGINDVVGVEGVTLKKAQEAVTVLIVMPGNAVFGEMIKEGLGEDGL